jgi:cyclopropane-fatty-acyl-phospholipid synthase
MSEAKTFIQDLLKLADIKVDGPRPFDITIHNEKFYKRALRDRELGVGESYMDGWWDAKNLDQFIARVVSANLQSKLKVSPKVLRILAWSVIRNQQTVKKARHNAAHHYNVGNDLYKLMLDKRMIYSCGYWKNAKNLDEAQEAKLELICQKLELKKGMALLDIGCGWGGFAEYAAHNYDVRVTGITPAEEQYKIAVERTKGLSIDIQLKDYREVTGTYDRIVSIGMLEHVGPKNYKKFFRHCHGMLKDGGIMLHHTIGNNKSVTVVEPWMDKYIFPGGVIPSLAQISKAVERKLVIEDVQNFGPDYDKTLMEWHANFVRNYPKIKNVYDQRFYRMWEFYLLACAANFRIRNLQLWQIVMRKIEPSKTYIAPR